MQKKTIVKWVTEDGKAFDFKYLAEAHEDLLKLKSEYESIKMYGQYEGCRIDWDEFLTWIYCHLDFIRSLVITINKSEGYGGSSE